MAFAGTDITNVVLPYTVSSIGHKAFYGCEKLSVVTFTSYNAPILEELYDYTYYNDPNNWPTKKSGITGNHGLDVIGYHMWTVSSSPNNILYGANFVDYIGKLDQKLVMVRPSNGLNYDSFTFGNYFSTVVNGKPAADAITLEAISIINRLPDNVSLDDEDLVILARQAYDRVANNEQRALVTEYAKLTKAEKRIEDLKYLEQEDQPSDPPADDNPPAEPPVDKTPGYVIVLIVVGSVLGAALIAGGAVFAVIYFRRKKAAAIPSAETSAPSEEVKTSEQTAAPAEEAKASEETTETPD